MLTALPAVILLAFLRVGSADESTGVKTEPLRVPYGRSVLVNPQTGLVLKYPPRAHCRVDVLRDNPLSERNGFLVPDVFPCDFKLGDVRYTHLGSKFHTQDFAKLQLRVDTENATKIVPFQLKIYVLFTPMEIVRKNLPVVVPEVGGLSSSIGEDVLSFVYDSESEFCHVALLRFHQPIPRYGDLLNVTTANSMAARFDCNDFLTSDIRYQHMELQSSNRDYVPLVVEISDKSLSVMKREYFQIIIRILGARVNERPTASFQASNTLEVKDQALGAVTSSVLAAIDLETKEAEIIFNVSKDLGAGEGQLINLDDPYRPLTAFYQEDVQHLKIAYRPPIIKNGKSRMFQVVLNAIDAEGAISDPILLLIMVKPTNVNAPVVIKNTGLSLFEGQARPLSTANNLHIADNNNMDDVQIQVIDGLNHGDLRIMGHKITTFMATDLDYDDVKYHHDGSETYSDNIVFRMTDETHVIEFVFPITIAPVDDQPPSLMYNTGLVLDEGGLAKIDQYMLSAIDVDSEDLKIQFKVALSAPLLSPSPAQRTLPPIGVLCLRRRSIFRRELYDWVLKPDRFYEKNTTRFTQEDIVNGRVFYRHLGGEVFRDHINFLLSDNAPIPNVSPVQTFNILVNRVDDLPPKLYPGSTLFIDVDEFGQTVINNTVLQYTDDDSKYTDLTYTISKPPYFIDRINSTVEAGYLILVDNAMEISKFTQLELNHGKISYVAPDFEIGVLARHAQFEFSVSDAAGNTLRGQIAKVVIKPVNNQAPKAIIDQLEVDEFSEAVIDNNIIRIYDRDTAVHQIQMSFTRLPRYGILLLDSVPMKERDMFTMMDIFSSVLKYQHAKIGEASDEAGLVVDDGVHKKVALLEIVIKSAPQNETKMTLNITLSVKERSKETLKLPCCLQDPGSKEETKTNSTLQVVTPPRVGRILLDDKTCVVFRVIDVMTGRVSYEHTGDETGIKGDEDQFNLVFGNRSAMLMGGRKYYALRVMTHIVPIDNQPPSVVIQRPLTVREGDKATLTQQHLTITDPDTREKDITCMIDVQPTTGYFENVLPSPGSEISNAGKRITSFTVQDIKRGNINYVQSEHDGIEPRIDWVAFSCVDTNNSSPRYLFNIIILPTNDEVPHLYYRDFITEEGAELVIDVTLLNAVDGDAPLDELMFHVLEPPKHGLITDTRIEGNIPVSEFTLTQIRKSNSIVYLHDGSETANDSLHLAVSDGIHNTSQVIPIKILPVDDEEPRLSVNKGLHLQAMGESDVLTPQNLQATDIDSPQENMTFILRVAPKAGILQKLDKRGTLRNLTQGDEFTQTDINRRLVVYSHDKRIPAVRDEMYFDVSDGTNTLLNQPFYVFIKTDHRIPPTVINKSVRLNQGSTVTITTDFLSAHDLSSANTRLIYTLTKLPSQGHLEISDAPGVAVISFTQMDIASNMLMYVHTSDEESAGDSFDFEVTDESRTVVVTRRFLITLLDVDNKKPVALCSTLYVQEGRSALITPFALRAEDRDTKPESLVFTITRVPLHGMLLNRGVNVRRFSQSDINGGLMSYFHDGTDTTKDNYFLSLSDGSNKEFYLSPNTRQPRTKPFEVHVNITAVDNRPPQMVHNRGVTDLQVLLGGRLGFILDENILKTEDRDSNESALIYQINRQPLNGYLTRSLSSNTSLTNFSQDDINSRKIYYVLRPRLNVTSDVFTFSVSDPAENILPSQQFSIVWARVSFTQEFYAVNETEGFLRVTLHREGFLGDSSFVRIEMKSITAHVHGDYSSAGSTHVQFSPGQTKATWKLRIVDDSKHEGNETLQLHLINPMNCVIGARKRSMVTILDPEDIPTVEMVHQQKVVQESVGQVMVQIRRTGDTSTKVQVVCITKDTDDQGAATGTLPRSILSYSDFVIRKNHPDSVITINKGETTATCPVVIIDDSLYEDEERFLVKLLPFQGSHVNSHHSNTEVVILPDRSDEPSIAFDGSQYSVDESDALIEITVKRTGTDLSKSSTVFLRSKQTEPISAQALKDYIPVTQLVHFAPYVTTQNVRVTILDDTGFPKVEGEERFELLLRTPINARLGKTTKRTVVIDDTFSDLPIVQFKKQSLSVKEDSGLQQVILTRFGDLAYTSSVRCYTRQDTAKSGKDFTERTNTDQSLVVFAAGETSKDCEVMVTNDVIYEGKERFRLVVESANQNTRMGSKNYTVITIDDVEDEPLVQLDEDRLFVGEPAVDSHYTRVTITVRRTGDPTVDRRVRVYTMDGTAIAGQDYQPITQVLSFTGNETIHKERIKILFNKNRKIRRAFTIHITADTKGSSVLGRKKTTVYIEKTAVTSSVIFPLAPKVLSLRHYDDVNGGSKDIPIGYPLVCVTACDPKFSRYSETGSMCASQNIDNKLTRYSWQISKATDQFFSDITADTFFTQTNRVTLDSIYLTPGIRIRCIARAVTSSGELGLESISQSVATKPNKGLCQARDVSHVGSELFSANIAFTGARDDGKSNMVHLKVQIPHFDGLIPIISTRMPDIRDLLSPGALRVAQYKCSNALDIDEITTLFGFLNSGIKDAGIIEEVEPYQFSTELRGNTTVRFYKNLNLDSCVWNFESYFHIDELIQKCGGSLTTGQHAKGLTQSQLSLRVPLYVSYVYRNSKSDWLHYDHMTFLRLTLVYDTAILLKDGVQTPEGSIAKGSLWLISIKIRNSDKKLVVRFKTITKFRGAFLLRKQGFSAVAMVISRDHPQLGFTLQMLSSEKTYDNPVQRWEFVSDYAAKDYTGSYYIKLIPCAADMDTAYSEPLACNPKQPVTFNLPIRFQQIPDPVPARFTLSVKFNLMADKKLWLTGRFLNKTDGELDIAFSKDSKIYGRISLDQGRQGADTRSGYQVFTEKVFLCSSDGEFIPSYEPGKKQFGCLEDSQYLVHRMKVLDREEPDSVSQKLGKAVFHAQFASDDPDASALVLRTDSDGFVMNSAPLFEVPRAQKWYMHAVYSVSSDPRKSKRKPRQIEAPHLQDINRASYHVVGYLTDSKQSLSQSGQRQSSKGVRIRRANEEPRTLGQGTGTNMKMIRLIYESLDEASDVPFQGQGDDNHAHPSKSESNLVNPLVIGVSGFCGVLLIALVVVWILYKRKGRPDLPVVQAGSHAISSSNVQGTVV